MSDDKIVHNFEVRDLEISKIVVFADRAEIRRLVRVELKEGVNEVLVKHLSTNVIHDSLRVLGRGKATILNVKQESRPELAGDGDSEKVAELRRDLEKCEDEYKLVEARKTVIQKRIDVLDKIVSDIGTGAAFNGGNLSISNSTFEGLTSLLAFHEEKSVSSRTDLFKIGKELDEAQKRLDLARNKLCQAECDESNYKHASHAVITLEAAEDVSVELDVSYQVFNASWTPSYDVRVDSDNATMDVTYYGQILQHTGEDWTEVPVYLTTAQPCTGGTIPELGTLDVAVKDPEPVCQTNQLYGVGSSYGGRSMMKSARMECAPIAMDVARASVNNQALSTEFKTARLETIPTGSSSHKVTIGATQLSPKFVYESVPSKNAVAFLAASAINTSDLTFIAGGASVYLDNAFVSNSSLKNVSPGERFTCSLGIDSALKVEYKPARKFKEQVGEVNKISVVTTEQAIVLKNTRLDKEVVVTVKHHVPRSTDDRIKLNLISPEAAAYDPKDDAEQDSEPKEGAKLNAGNNLEWTVKIGGGESKILNIKWTIEHPKEEKIEFDEKF